jgi:hypothetical protein
MRKTFFCGGDLHSNNATYVIIDQQDKPLFKKRLPNQLLMVLESGALPPAAQGRGRRIHLQPVLAGRCSPYERSLQIPA